jgi:hypothetical protein
MKALDDQDKGERINALDVVKVKTDSEDDKFKVDKRAFDDQSEGTNSYLFSLNTSYSKSSDSVLNFSTSQTLNLSSLTLSSNAFLSSSNSSTSNSSGIHYNPRLNPPRLSWPSLNCQLQQICHQLY